MKYHNCVSSREGATLPFPVLLEFQGDALLDYGEPWCSHVSYIHSEAYLNKKNVKVSSANTWNSISDTPKLALSDNILCNWTTISKISD